MLMQIQVILEAYHSPESDRTVPKGHIIDNGQDERTIPELLLISANTAVSLKDQIQRVHDFVQSGSAPNVHDLAFTLNTRREKLPHRAFTVVKDREVIETSGLAKAPAKAQDVYLIFSGQGAQWAGMCSVLVVVERSVLGILVHTFVVFQAI